MKESYIDSLMCLTKIAETGHNQQFKKIPQRMKNLGCWNYKMRNKNKRENNLKETLKNILSGQTTIEEL